MIPLHKPPFGLVTVITSSLRPGQSRSLRRLEEAYSQASGSYAVWLPSARAGICWALRASVSNQTTVIGPAFTCTVVHEAIARSGGNLHLLEPAVDSFLMDAQVLAKRQSGNCALVLSETYGHTYDLEDLARDAASAPTVRIVDMAMSVPHPALFQRLRARDFGVISFGNGKSMYAGWGGMGFARDPVLAEEVRKIRDQLLAQGNFSLWWKRAAGIASRTVAHYPSIYAFTWRLWYQARPFLSRARRWRRSPAQSEPAALAPAQIPAAWSDDRALAPEWRLPSTQVDRGLAMWNLEGAGSFHAARLALARRYEKNLAGIKGIARPRTSPWALSHYSVRVDAGIRNLVKQRLWQAGVYTISLWTFPQHLDRQQFPNTFRTSSEVINLPLAPWMPMDRVDGVCELLVRSVEACHR